jgi:hypothetical protein
MVHDRPKATYEKEARWGLCLFIDTFLSLSRSGGPFEVMSEGSGVAFETLRTKVYETSALQKGLGLGGISHAFERHGESVAVLVNVEMRSWEMLSRKKEELMVPPGLNLVFNINSGCTTCFGYTKKRLICGRCKRVSYCGKLCQKIDWPVHKVSCKSPEQLAKETQKFEAFCRASEERLPLETHLANSPLSESKKKFMASYLKDLGYK